MEMNMFSLLIIFVVSIYGIEASGENQDTKFILQVQKATEDDIVYDDRNSTLWKTVDISRNCLGCICQVEGCQRLIGKCRMDVGSLSCGPFQIKKNYWMDCGRPGADWQSCAKQMACSITCVERYMARYASRCTGGRRPTCEDFAKIHNGGPRGCRKPLAGYWGRVKACCGTKAGGCGY